MTAKTAYQRWRNSFRTTPPVVDFCFVALFVASFWSKPIWPMILFTLSAYSVIAITRIRYE